MGWRGNRALCPHQELVILGQMALVRQTWASGHPGAKRIGGRSRLGDMRDTCPTLSFSPHLLQVIGKSFWPCLQNVSSFCSFPPLPCTIQPPSLLQATPLASPPSSPSFSPSITLFQPHWSPCPGLLHLRAFALAVPSAQNTLPTVSHIAPPLTSFGSVLWCHLGAVALSHSESTVPSHCLLPCFITCLPCQILSSRSTEDIGYSFTVVQWLYNELHLVKACNWMTLGKTACPQWNW